jgi:tetratricopeptide (TPR) repeat protein
VRAPVRKSAVPRSGSDGLKDIDSSARARRLQAFTWSFTGACIGGMAGYTGMLYGRWGQGMTWVLGLGGMVVAFTGPLVVAALSGRAAGTLYSPSGSGTPRKREFSHAESLAARGLYDEAVAAFEVAIAENPTDPVPHLRVARIHRDRSRRYEDATRWFKSAFDLMEPGSGPALLTLKELVELHTVKLGTPARTAPLLARLAAERADTPEGKWAAEELSRVKERMGGPTDG